MEIQMLQYEKTAGWLPSKFPDLDSEQTLVLVFSAPEFVSDPEPIHKLVEHYPKSKIVGCSSAGEIFGPHVSDHSISVAVVRFEHTPLKIVKTDLKGKEDSFTAGEQIANKLKGEDLRGIFVLSDGLKVNGSELVNGLNAHKRKEVVVTGGLAGDGDRFQKTWSIFNGKIHQDCVIAIGFYGNHIHIAHASRGGWDSFGLERQITKASGNVLYELDGRPALEIYKEYLGERAAGLPATGLLYPLAIRKNTDDKRALVRTILSVDEEEQSLTFAGDMPGGYLARLMHANFDRLITSAGEAGEVAKKSIFDSGEEKNLGQVLSVAVSCVGRKLLLGERTEEETESLLEILPKGTEQIGFYSYGEISPYTIGNCDLHNQTMTLTTFYESQK